MPEIPTKESGIFKSYDEMTPDQRVAFRLGEHKGQAEREALREALVALVDVQPYLHPNRTKALKWEDKRQVALDLAAAALEYRP